MKLGIINANAFARTLIGKKASRYIEKLFNGIGRDSLTYMIANDKDMLSYITDISQYRRVAYGHQYVASLFTDQDVYSWVPKDYKAFIESYPHGKAWALRQIKDIGKQVFGIET